MFYKKSQSGYKTAREGVHFKTLAFGEKTHLTEFHLEKGSIIPMHTHFHEQTGYLVSGHMKFVIAGERFDAQPGDGWNISGNIEHGVEVLEDSVVIEIFSPAREDYLA
ncbi:MAG: cupin domain-containing protein [Candidatus Aminicenantales bacterium]